jgi:hypothetical protein
MVREGKTVEEILAPLSEYCSGLDQNYKDQLQNKKLLKELEHELNKIVAKEKLKQ